MTGGEGKDFGPSQSWKQIDATAVSSTTTAVRPVHLTIAYIPSFTVRLRVYTIHHT